MSNEIRTKVNSSLLFISIGFILLFWLILFNSEFVSGEKLVLDLTGTIPIALVTAIIFVTVTKHLVNKARIEQYLEDTIRSNRIHEAEKKEFLAKLEQYEGVADLYYDIRAKLEASQIYEVPILGAYLLEKKVLLQYEQAIKVEFELGGNFAVLNQIEPDDMVKIIDDSISRIIKMQEEYGNKIDQLHIITYEEKDNFVIDLFTFIDYNSTPGRDSETVYNVNNDQFLWNMKKRFNKYKADISILIPEEGKDEGNFTSLIRIKFPHEGRRAAGKKIG